MRIYKTEDIERCLKIRYEVFVDEQKVPFELEKDENDSSEAACDHFMIEDENGAAGTFRCTIENGDTIHLQRLCIKKSRRGCGYGRAALAFAESYYPGMKKITLGAQCQAIPFYEKCGLTVVSGIFDDAGIPHRTMEKLL